MLQDIIKKKQIQQKEYRKKNKKSARSKKQLFLFKNYNLLIKANPAITNFDIDK